MNFADRMQEAVARCGNAALVGLDPHADSLPEDFAAVRAPGSTRAERARACADFLCQVIELARGLVPAVKPQSAFFELYGADGAAAWERVVAAARTAGLLVIGDVKRGDIDSTAKAYARAYLDPSIAGEAVCDAITVNPYLGADAVQPFVEACRAHDAGLFVLVRTSNKHSALFQDHGTPRLYEHVARAVDAWGSELVGASELSSISVVGTSTELSALRKLLPRTPFLIPATARGAGAAEIDPDSFQERSRRAGQLLARDPLRAQTLRATQDCTGRTLRAPRYTPWWKSCARSVVEPMLDAPFGPALVRPGPQAATWSTRRAQQANATLAEQGEDRRAQELGSSLASKDRPPWNSASNTSRSTCSSCRRSPGRRSRGAFRASWSRSRATPRTSRPRPGASPARREELVGALERALPRLRPHVAVLDALRSLARPGASAIVTRTARLRLPQARSTRSRSAHRRALARTLSQAWEKPVVALFWNHADDHDVAEVTPASGQPQPRPAESRAAQALLGAHAAPWRSCAFEEALDLPVLRALFEQELRGALPHLAEALAMLFPRAGGPLQVRCRALTRLCGPLGLVVVEPQWISSPLSRIAQGCSGTTSDGRWPKAAASTARRLRAC